MNISTKSTDNHKKILAVVLNWNDFDNTSRCIASLINQEGILIDILVIDNGSTIDPIPLLSKKFPQLKFIRNKTNIGVSGGRNIGILFALKHEYDYILLIDNDAFADHLMVTNLLNASRRFPSVGILGPKIFRDDKPNIIWRAGCISWKWTYLHSGSVIINQFFQIIKKFPPDIINIHRGLGQHDHLKFNIEKSISFQIGCAQLIRVEVFKTVGFLDEEFSPYGGEDIDFCSRAQKDGWGIFYVPQASCRHRFESSFKDEYLRSFYNMRHIILLARKNLTSFYFAFLFTPDFLFITFPLILINSILSKNPKKLRGIFDAFTWHLKDIKKRGILIRRPLYFTNDKSK